MQVADWLGVAVMCFVGVVFRSLPWRGGWVIGGQEPRRSRSCRACRLSFVRLES